MLKLHEAKNIYEVACGSGRLLPFALRLKHPDASYYATDLVQDMIEKTHATLKNNFDTFNSKDNFEQWMKK